MAKKKQKQTKLITPLKISVGINVVLSLMLISAISVSVWAYHQYKGGTERAANFALLHMNDFCDMRERNMDKWENKNQIQMQLEAENGTSPKQIKDSKEIAEWNNLSTNMLCTTDDFEPYLRKAAEDYYRTNGLELFPKE